MVTLSFALPDGGLINMLGAWITPKIEWFTSDHEVDGANPNYLYCTSFRVPMWTVLVLTSQRNLT